MTSVHNSPGQRSVAVSGASNQKRSSETNANDLGAMPVSKNDKLTEMLLKAWNDTIAGLTNQRTRWR